MTTDNTPQADVEAGKAGKKSTIHIDREAFVVTAKHLTGAELRALPKPPIGPERDLYEIRPGQDDLLVDETTRIEIHDGERFFTAPGRINPGCGR